MNRKPLVLSLLLVGFALLGLGLAWNRIVPTTAFWSPEEAIEHSTAQAELHSISHSHGHDEEHEREVAAARDRFLKINQQLEDARGSRHRSGTFFTAAGIGLLVLGIMLHYAAGPSK